MEDPPQYEQKPSKNSATLKDILAGKKINQFAQDYVHNIHSKRIEFESNSIKKPVSNPHRPLYKSGSTLSPGRHILNEDNNNNHRDITPSIYTYLSNSIRIELEKQSIHKNRGNIEPGLIHKLCTNVLVPEKERRIEEKVKAISIKNIQDNLCDRLLKENDQKKFKLEESAKKFNESIMVDCSFHPKINKSDSPEKRRNPEEFYRSQLQWEEKIKGNIKIQQENFEKNEINEINKPQISKKTTLLAEKKIKSLKKSNDVHQRLYEFKKDAQLISSPNKTFDQEKLNSPLEDSGFFTNRPQAIQNQLTFSPKISNKTRKILLEKKEKREKSPNRTYKCQCPNCQNKSNPQHLIPITKIQLSKNSSQVFVNRFIKEFNQKLSEITHDESLIKLHFIELESILIGLNFLNHESEHKEIIGKEISRKTNNQTIKEIWNSLRGKQKTSIITRNLLVFLLAILNLKPEKNQIPLIEDSNLIKDEIDDSLDVSILDDKIKNYGRFTFYGNLELSDDDIKKIHNDFQSLFLNRLARSKEIIEKQEEFPFSPNISKKSNILADQKKKKFIDSLDENIKNIDFYSLENLRNKQKDDQVIKLKNSIQENSIIECTFTPKVNDFHQTERILKLSHEPKSIKTQTSPISEGLNRFEDLYSLKKNQNLKKDKDINELEYEKYCDQCTFKPDLNRSNLDRTIFNPKIIYADGIEKNIKRIQDARIEKNLIEEQKKNGYTNNDNKRNKIYEEVKKNEPEKSLLFQSISPKKKTINKTESNNNNEQTSPGLKNYTTIIPEDGIPTFGLRNEDDDRIPLLFVDVNITEGRNARIVIYEGDKPEILAEKFAEEYQLDKNMTSKLKELLELQINNLLHKIEEEENFSESLSQKE